MASPPPTITPAALAKINNDVFDYPAKPAGLTLPQTGPHVALSWNAVAGSDITYNVYRSTLAGVKGTLLGENLTTTNFADSGISEEETYYYSVTAKNKIAEGYASNTANTKLLFVAVPTKIEAEKSTGMSGIQLENSSDIGGWQTWITKSSSTFALSAGNHTLRFRSLGKEWNINWFEIKKQ